MSEPATQLSPIREQAAIERGLAMDATTFTAGNSVFSNGTAFQLAVKMADFLAHSTIIPESFRGNTGNCLIALDYAARLGVSVPALMQNMDVVKGRPSLRGSFLIGIVNSCGKFSDLDFEWKGERGTDAWGCRAVATRLSDGKVLQGTWIDMAMVKAEKWIDNAKWKNMPEQMFPYRAASFWSRVHASDVTLGLYESDEAADIAGGNGAVRVVGRSNGVGDLAERLKARGLGQPVIDLQPTPPADMDPATGEVPAPTAAEPMTTKWIKAALHLAETREQVIALGDAIASIPDDAERQECEVLYDERLVALA